MAARQDDSLQFTARQWRPGCSRFAMLKYLEGSGERAIFSGPPPFDRIFLCIYHTFISSVSVIVDMTWLLEMAIISDFACGHISAFATCVEGSRLQGRGPGSSIGRFFSADGNAFTGRNAKTKTE